ncbi:MAG: AI-2E family transporter [Bacteroidaceae bacterium]
MKKEITFDRFIRGIITAILIFGVFYFINLLRSVLLPFFIAWLFAYLMYPTIHFFETKIKIKFRIVTILLTLFIWVNLFALFLYFVIPPSIVEIMKVKGLITEYFSSGFKYSNIPAWITDFLQKNINAEEIKKWLSTDEFKVSVQQALPKVWSFVSGSFNFIINIISGVIVLLYLVFILMDYEQISEKWDTLIPKRYRKQTSNVVKDVQAGMNRYFRGQSTVALCVGILLSIGFLIIDFPMAIALGLFIGFLNLVPYLQIIGIVPMALLAVLKAADSGGNFWIIFGSSLLVMAIVQIIQDGYIVPKIMGKITGLNPAAILLSLSIWGSLLGVIGMIIALPFTTLLLSYYRQFLQLREEEKEEGPINETGNSEIINQKIEKIDSNDLYTKQQEIDTLKTAIIRQQKEIDTLKEAFLDKSKNELSSSPKKKDKHKG